MGFFSNSSIIHGMNLRKNSVTSQISSGFKVAPWKNRCPNFCCKIHLKTVKNTLTTQTIIDIWNVSLWVGKRRELNLNRAKGGGDKVPLIP